MYMIVRILYEKSFELCFAEKEIFCAEMFGSCLGVTALAIVYEGLKVFREYIDLKLRHEVCCGNRHVQDSTDNVSQSVSTSDSKAPVPQQYHASDCHCKE